MVRKFLKSLRWILLPVTAVCFLLFIEAATDEYGISSDEEGLMCLAWIILAINVCLFVFNAKWQKLVDAWLPK